MLMTFKTGKSVMIEMIFRQKKHRIKKNIPYALFLSAFKIQSKERKFNSLSEIYSKFLNNIRTLVTNY